MEPGAPSLLVCEGVSVYLGQPVLAAVLAELRAVAAPGTRLALSVRPPARSADDLARQRHFDTAVAVLGEPVLNSVSADELSALLATARWRATHISERSRLTGFAVAAPA